MLSINLNLRRGCLLLAAAALVLFSRLQAAGPAAKKFGDEYAGSQTCQTCHEDLYNNLQKSAHSFVETNARGGWKDHACEACHGPGTQHTQSVSPEDIKNPGKLDAVATDKICLGCHLNTSKHSERIQSSHMKDTVSCVACHTVHAKGPAGLVEREPAKVNALCESCHQNVKAQFAKPYRHKIPENEMSCVDCHNPHGSMRPVMGQTFASNEPGCFRCHSDKRGPFTFEHAPVRYEGCPTCHDVHGSANPRLLNRGEVRQTCLECHSNLPSVLPNANAQPGVVPPAFHDLRSPRYQNCTVCHQKVHGSYADRSLLR
jgi:DmsE family decaheme c-type cytochrome